jgi:hypothetical protein
MTVKDMKVSAPEDLAFMESLFRHWHMDNRKDLIEAFVHYHNILMNTGLIKYSVHAGSSGTRERAGLTYVTSPKKGRARAASSFDIDGKGFKFKFFKPDLKPYTIDQQIVSFTKRDWSGHIYLTPQTLSEVLKFSESSFLIVLKDSAKSSFKLNLPGKTPPQVASSSKPTPTAAAAVKVPISAGNMTPIRIATVTNRIQRDSVLSTQVKQLHAGHCQICGHRIELPDGSFYAEAHHIQPLGAPYHGPDVIANILCVCPNHHVELDYHALKLDESKLCKVPGHQIGKAYVNHHNNLC